MGDGLLRAVRINPRRFTLGLYAVKAGDHPTPQTMRQWVAAKGLVAAINASMYRMDFATSVSYMRKAGQLLNSRFSADNSFFVMGKDGTGAASARLLDRQCDDLENLLPQQTAVVQSIRMISCKGRNVWVKSKKIWSTAALAQDKDGNILMLHVRAPYSVHDFNQMLLALPLGIIRAMYVEGGPEAQLSLHAGGLQIDLVGSYETGFNENDDNHRGWDVPNIIGARRKVPE